jgi:hypothetical protein
MLTGNKVVSFEFVTCPHCLSEFVYDKPFETNKTFSTVCINEDCCKDLYVFAEEKIKFITSTLMSI